VVKFWSSNRENGLIAFPRRGSRTYRAGRDERRHVREERCGSRSDRFSRDAKPS